MKLLLTVGTMTIGKEKNFRYNFSNLYQALANLNNKLYDNMA